MSIAIGIVDDHQLFLKSLSLLMSSFNNYSVVVEALNGKDLQEKMKQLTMLPEMILLDVNMPEMNGLATVQWLTATHPNIKVIALSMNDNDKTIIEMIKAGCCAYLLKDTHPNELEKALNDVYHRGYYNGDVSNINYRRLLMAEKESELLNITEREKEFLQLACSDLTYKNIAGRMGVSERTVDGYRENLFSKLKVSSRVGLALEAIRKDLVKL